MHEKDLDPKCAGLETPLEKQHFYLQLTQLQLASMLSGEVSPSQLSRGPSQRGPARWALEAAEGLADDVCLFRAVLPPISLVITQLMRLLNAPTTILMQIPSGLLSVMGWLMSLATKGLYREALQERVTCLQDDFDPDVFSDSSSRGFLVPVFAELALLNIFYFAAPKDDFSMLHTILKESFKQRPTQTVCLAAPLALVMFPLMLVAKVLKVADLLCSEFVMLMQAGFLLVLNAPQKGMTLAHRLFKSKDLYESLEIEEKKWPVVQVS